MAKFVFIYRGGGGMPESDEAMQAAMAAWQAWFGEIGADLADGGNPFGASATVGAGGAVSSGTSSGVSGYSIVNAADLDAAAAVANGCPLLAHGGTVEVFEALDM